MENGLKREICNIHGNSGLEIGLEILSVLWLIKIHPQWKHEGFTVILKSMTSSSLTLENMWVSMGLAHEFIIPTDQNQVLKELGFCQNTNSGYGSMTSKVPKEDSWQGPYYVDQSTWWWWRGRRAAWRVSVAPGSQEAVSFGSMNQHHSLWWLWNAFLTWERLSGASSHRASQGGEPRQVLRQVSTEVCERHVWQQSPVL